MSDEKAYPIDPERLIQADMWMAEADHPIITGKCPQCQYKFLEDNPPEAHWDCPKCGWIDDSI